MRLRPVLIAAFVLVLLGSCTPDSMGPLSGPNNGRHDSAGGGSPGRPPGSPAPAADGAFDPQYPSLPGGQSYRMNRANLADGVQVPTEAKKWGLTIQPDGSTRVSGQTIRLKFFTHAGALSEDDILKRVSAINPDWSYDRTRQMGHWLADTDWKNVEITALVTMRKPAVSPGWIGFVMRSCIHDPQGDSQIAGYPLAFHAGSSYHSNFYDDGTHEHKIEFYHAGYKIYPRTPGIALGSLIDKQIGMKVAIYNTSHGTVKVETYFDGEQGGMGPYRKLTEIELDGSENSQYGLFSFGSPYVIFKSNEGTWDLHDVEIREIIPPP